jgi:hypothetical protein
VSYPAVGVSAVISPAPSAEELGDALTTVARLVRVPVTVSRGNMPSHQQWWLAVLVVACSVLVHGWLTRPARYTFQPLAGGTPRQWVRVDHWTGELRAGEIQPKDARAAGWWQPIAN